MRTHFLLFSFSFPSARPLGGFTGNILRKPPNGRAEVKDRKGKEKESVS